MLFEQLANTCGTTMTWVGIALLAVVFSGWCLKDAFEDREAVKGDDPAKTGFARYLVRAEAMRLTAQILFFLAGVIVMVAIPPSNRACPPHNPVVTLLILGNLVTMLGSAYAVYFRRNELVDRRTEEPFGSA